MPTGESRQGVKIRRGRGSKSWDAPSLSFDRRLLPCADQLEWETQGRGGPAVGICAETRGKLIYCARAQTHPTPRREEAGGLEAGFWQAFQAEREVLL